ncbi:malate dehydrogenase [Virgibacillus ainsalahensis]
MAKISIIGAAGTLGAAISFQLARKEKLNELCLIDVNENLLKNHWMDLQNAYPDKKIYIGDYSNLTESTIIIITAGVPNRNDVTSRNDFLKDNIKLFKEFGRNIKKYSPQSIIVTASNPVDILNYYLYKEFQFSKQQLIGYTMNDSFRFEWALRETLNVYDDRFFTPVLGEHGESQVPIFSNITRNGEPFVPPESQQEIMKTKLQNWFIDFNSLNINRTTGWTTARGIDIVTDKLLQDEETEMIGSVILHGEYSVKDVSLGSPVLVNKNGVQQIDEWNLKENERKSFRESSEKVKKTLQAIVGIE